MSALRYGSVCSGIEAATVAWHPLGWKSQFFSEIEAAPRAVLAHHYPEVPLHGDFTTIQDGQYGAIDLLVGGTPCQSFSVAGLRGGLADDRGNLALQYLRLAQRLRPRWLVWENVPGVLSSWSGPKPPSDLEEGQEWEAHETSDFGCFLSGMVELGYGFAYRVLDAQYVRVDGFGRAVPQRRRRVFVVGHLGDWRRAAAVLFERASLRGDTAPRREAGADTPVGALAGTSPGGGWRLGADEAAAGQLVASVGPTLPSRSRAGGGMGTDFDCDGGLAAHSLRGEGFDASEDGTGRGTPIVPVAFGGGNTSGPIEVETCLTNHASRSDFDTETFIASAFDARQSDVIQYGPITGPLDTDGHTIGVLVDADASQARSDQALRALRDAVGEEAFATWGAGVVAALRTQEVLRSGLHGEGVRRAAHDRHKLDDDALPRSEAGGAGPVRALWDAGCIGCPPPGWQPSERLARELSADLSELSRQGASAERLMLGLWRASEGLGLLREALSALQEARRPAHDEGQPAPTRWAVRRLTPLEAERLQGFPDGYTAVPWRGGILSDDPRYKALGNSMACNVMRWIGTRIQMVEALGLPLAEPRHLVAAE